MSFDILTLKFKVSDLLLTEDFVIDLQGRRLYDIVKTNFH